MDEDLDLRLSGVLGDTLVLTDKGLVPICIVADNKNYYKVMTIDGTYDSIFMSYSLLASADELSRITLSSGHKLNLSIYTKLVMLGKIDSHANTNLVGKLLYPGFIKSTKYNKPHQSYTERSYEVKRVDTPIPSVEDPVMIYNLILTHADNYAVVRSESEPSQIFIRTSSMD